MIEVVSADRVTVTVSAKGEDVEIGTARLTPVAKGRRGRDEVNPVPVDEIGKAEEHPIPAMVQIFSWGIWSFSSTLKKLARTAKSPHPGHRRMVGGEVLLGERLGGFGVC